jgi:16S rRNA C967 or C1407 C5-methylase (RsmB/RsmF family)
MPVKSGVAVTMVDCIFDCPSINEEYIKDMYMLQNMPSIIAGHALMSGEINSEQCEMILDMCAAPGGKTIHIASILSRRGQGKIIALDKNQRKVNHIIKNCRQFGVESIVETHVRDSTKLLLGDTNNISDGNKIPIFNENMFDRILLDAPCSALGQRPQFKISMKPKELASFPKIQRKLFDVAYKLLKPGGVLVYSTCTFTIEENEGLVQWAMDNYTDDLTVESLFPTEDKPSSSDAEKHSKLKRLLNLGEPGIIIQNGGQHSEHIQLARRFGLSRGKKYKDDENCDTIGFFIVKFRKTIK